MAKRLPWMKWFPSDWRSESRLKMVSRAARSFWMDMIGLMHEADPYGHLLVGDVVPTMKQLAAILGDRESDATKWMTELEAAGVFSRTADGGVFSRRMVRDREKAEADSLNGKGGGNPRLVPPVNEGVNPPDNGLDKAQRLDASAIPKPSPNPTGFKENYLSKNGGKRDRDSVTIQDPDERIARFQKTVAESIGKGGWQIVGAAADPSSPEYEKCLAICKETALRLGKGWPHRWPAPRQVA